MEEDQNVGDSSFEEYESRPVGQQTPKEKDPFQKEFPPDDTPEGFFFILLFLECNAGLA